MLTMKKNIIAIFLIGISLLSCSSVSAKGQMTTTQVIRSLTLPLYTLQQQLPIKQSNLPAHAAYRTSNYLMYVVNKRIRKLSHQVYYWSMKIKQQFLVDSSRSVVKLSKTTFHHRQLGFDSADELTD